MSEPNVPAVSLPGQCVHGRWITLCLRLCMALHSAQSQPVEEAAGDAPDWEGLSSLRNATSVFVNCRKRGTNKMG